MNTAVSVPDAADTRRRIFAIVASASGNLVEWYDFYVYSFLALYFASEFFPEGDTTTQLLNAAAIFAAGFLMRPIGGWLFGRIADRVGRKRSMLISVTMMCAGSLVIAILPTYQTIGIFAPLLLLLMRLIQGLSVGGEYGTTATYMSEVALAGRRGFFGSFQYVTLIGGQLLAVLVLVVLQQFLDEAQLRAWGWRIPFAIGGVAAVIALYLRSSLHETSTAEARGREEAGSLAGLWRHHRRAFLIVLGYTAGGSLIFYTFTTYMQKYLVNTAGFGKEVASLTMTVVLLVYMLMQPIFGALSDRIGRRNSMLIWSSLSILTTVPLLSAIGRTSNAVNAFLLVTAALAIVSFYTSVSGIVKAEMFPAEVRALGVGFAYAIGNAVFGGTAEYAALWFKSVGEESWFFWYVTAMMGVAFISALLMPDARRHGYLQGEGTVD
ncbi:MHS family alpha-ketoglutarate permease-like MFS transporter [Pseudaminobacter salicylatoxidans]|uniref:Alpha-ketoglutarate permease n=1 Tax=Pseudaminobacter salicylatoxidans TaxID=93369 RepID=A0A316C3W9_PSESE|nr:MFS family transporter [Pseudaminobacter salicylatoxidans]PWJ84318.1 MHS family alpha-ketoglutarate permease-like MFS transporter [Pseudaminobacter salicylatoxidans]